MEVDVHRVAVLRESRERKGLGEGADGDLVGELGLVAAPDGVAARLFGAEKQRRDVERRVFAVFSDEVEAYAFADLLVAVSDDELRGGVAVCSDDVGVGFEGERLHCVFVIVASGEAAGAGAEGEGRRCECL